MAEQNPYRDAFEGRLLDLEKDVKEVKGKLNKQSKCISWRLTQPGKVAFTIIPLLIVLIIVAAVCAYYAWGGMPLKVSGGIACGLFAGVPALAIGAGVLGGCWSDFWQ